MEREVQLTKEYLKAMGNKYDLEIVHILDLSQLGLRSLGALGECANVIILNLSQNQLRSIKGLETLTKLKMLSLSYNNLANIDQIKPLALLEDLRLQGNQLDSYQSLDPLKYLSKLQHLRLQEFGQTNQNPICRTDSYRSHLLEMLPTLLSLDGHRRNSPFIELDEKAKEILSRGEESLGVDDLVKDDFKWTAKEELDASNTFSKVSTAGGNLVLEIEELIRGAEKNLREYDKTTTNY
eukprot:TRINITY_DN8415_c0_g1_i8.p1 TRINITY_DN8415_c0_g1~~TRINITY_DN8415_c0_g1_i8.p1  ORF type:complete len:238 (-),score=61.12 TRINITY_DN8415_c0_g1_i8:100-813(-)